MKATKGAVLSFVIVVASSLPSHAVVDQALEIQGTNLVLSWPSQGYEYYMIRYWPDLAQPPIQLTNCFPANSTNRTTFVLPCCTLAELAGTNGYFLTSMESLSTMTSSVDRWPSSLDPRWVMPADGSGGAVPFSIYPPGYDTRGLIFFDSDPNPQPTSVSNAYLLAGADSDGPMPAGFSNGGCDCPDIGFFQVWHIPDFPSGITNYTFDGLTFIPVDFKDYMDRVVDIQVLLDGEPTSEGEFASYVDNGQTNWGMNVYFDRIADGTHQIQLVSKLHLYDQADNDAVFLTLSNLTRSIVVDNQVTFTNWDDMAWNNTNYTFKARTKNPDTDWTIDIYDAWGYWINGASGHTTNGYIQWTWNLRDSDGDLRNDLDSDPFFDPWVTFDESGGGNGPAPAAAQTTRAMPLAVMPYPSVGFWLISFMDNFYEAGTPSNTKMVDCMHAIQGWVDYRGIPVSYFPIAFGTNGYTQVDRDGDWATMKSVLSHRDYRNFYYFGHGNSNSLGGDFNTHDTNGVVTGAGEFPGSKAHLWSSVVRRDVTFNHNSGVHHYRFVWLDGCNTALGGWPAAFGVNATTNDYAYYTNNANNPSHKRPSAFVGWATTVGGTGWGTITGFFFCRSEWMKEWTYYWQTRTLVDALEYGRNSSSWVQPGQFWSNIRVYGYNDLRIDQYNHQTQWPGP